MSKAEDRALERFPVHEGASKEWIESHLKGICRDYIEGYYQAEKDVFEWLKKHAYKYFLPGRKYVGAEEMVKDIEQIFSES